MIEQVSLITAFSAGILSFVSPCVLPLVPAYISFMSGVSVDDITGAEKQAVTMVLGTSLAFVAGFSLVFILLGATATFVGSFLLTHMSILAKVSGLLIIIFGLHFLGVYRIKFLLYEKRVQTSHSGAGVISAFVIGLAFAFGWTPCIGPVLAAILTLAAKQESVSKGMILLGAYSAGLGIPFLLTAAATNSFLNMFKKIKRHFRAIEIISGVFLILVGIFIMFDMFTIFAGYLIRWFPALGTIG